MREDLKTAIRSLLHARTFTGVALVVLALGIGATTAIFSVIDAVILKGLPFDEHDRLVAVLEHDTKRATTFGDGATTTQMYLDWRQHQQAFEGIAAVGPARFRVKTDHGEPDDLAGTEATWEFFSILRVTPILGRRFSADDEIEGRHRVAILSYGFWQRQFGGAPDVVGHTLDLDGESWQIVGVMPRGFAYPLVSELPIDLYVPAMFKAEDKIHGTGHNYNYFAIARLRPGVSIQQANAQMTQVTADLIKEFPKWSPDRVTQVIPLQERLVGRVRAWMLLLLGVVALVLVIACANVANLMLARATVRHREMALRAALGASRWRILRALLIEGLVLSGTGAALGLLLAYGGVQVLRLWLPADLPRVAAIAIDLRVLGAAISLAVLTGIVFGCVPAMQATRPDLVGALKESGGRGTTAGARSQRIRGALVIAEIALAVVLLVGAGLFIRSFINLMRVDVGLDYHNILQLSVGLRPKPEEAKDMRASQRGILYVQQVIEAVSRVPGVEMVGSVQGGMPLSGNWSRTDIKRPGHAALNPGDDGIDRRVVSPEYLKVLRVPLHRGRQLSAQDVLTAPRVGLINEAAAKKYWPGEDPLGQHFTLGKTDTTERTVVGIVGDVRHLGPELPARPEVYLPLGQDDNFGATLAIRTAGNRDPVQLLPAVKAAIWSVNPNQTFYRGTLTLDAFMDRFIAQRRFNMTLLALFGIVGLVIAAAGLYGVMAYMVAQRTGEIGVRMALGATPGDVVSMVLRQAAVLIVAGLGIGAAAAWYLGAGVGAFLFQVDANDARVFIGSLLVLAAAGLIASMVPARRAARVDPLIALRGD
jgi:putative ABC transport system permease protein